MKVITSNEVMALMPMRSAFNMYYVNREYAVGFPAVAGSSKGLFLNIGKDNRPLSDIYEDVKAMYEYFAEEWASQHYCKPSAVDVIL